MQVNQPVLTSRSSNTDVLSPFYVDIRHLIDVCLLGDKSLSFYTTSLYSEPLSVHTGVSVCLTQTQMCEPFVCDRSVFDLYPKPEQKRMRQTFITRPEDLRESHNINVFKSKLKTYLFGLAFN